MRGVVLISVLFMLAYQACNRVHDDTGEEPVARVFDKYLYPSDLREAIPEGSLPQDSTYLANRYIDTWIKDELMLHHAELALPDEQKNFEKQIQEYRKSLLIYTYRQKLLQQKLDTLVDEEKIRSYYEENINNFLLSEDIIKGTFIKLPLSAPRISEVRTWSRSNTADDLDYLEKYCINYAEKYTDFNNNWVYFSTIKNQLPLEINDPSRYLRYNRNIETTDSLYRYFLHISDHLTEGEVAPLEMVTDDIISILLNKRKIEFFRNLEVRVYNEGVSRNQFEIFK